MVYAPGTLETDPKKQNMALQQQASSIKNNTSDIATNTADIATNTANIATNTTNIATNTSNISTLQTKTNGYEAAWSSWTPTPTPSGGGSFTTVTASGSYLQIGKLVHFRVVVTLTNIGTGAGKVQLPLPVGTAKGSFVASGAEIAAVGKAITYTVSTGASSGTIQAYDNATNMMVNSYQLNLTGLYEAS